MEMPTYQICNPSTYSPPFPCQPSPQPTLGDNHQPTPLTRSRSVDLDCRIQIGRPAARHVIRWGGDPLPELPHGGSSARAPRGRRPPPVGEPPASPPPPVSASRCAPLPSPSSPPS